ncbi:4-hydroxyphenylpyruvate dioxygenase family protein [Aspergillus saccharolyticus JOP 1030-1]|uniref:4-hydroxyphenylpyruvate dioxygenase n=1 Tax=Aspergillus saccharolyticus JOP 1030-1 TaxID=1450539 RepID=A0A318ZCG8_9EURO|nr:4-hydroxyphenylpyruvate dioxygenase 2 [Aspergillus saccharolyticus JOP 1030-1]PYH45181.1 4-hydroxyphenylpyruvate dioxygenase 2 [Aspergillus saccharolyticus JOP 1030-1]
MPSDESLAHPTTANNAVLRSINPNYTGYDYVSWYVGNARQAATYFVAHFGFSISAYRGPETGSYLTCSYVVSNGTARFVFTAPIVAADNASENRSEEDRGLLAEIQAHLNKHGDGVKDIAFQVDDVTGVWEHAVKNGALSLQEPTILKDEIDGEVLRATIKTYGDTAHTLINRSAYRGPFLPGYSAVPGLDRLNDVLPPVNVIEIDHCVGNQPWDGLDTIVKFYEDALNFHRYWTVDDKEMCSEFSAMRSAVVASPNEVIKMPMNEPAVGLKKSQIEEFVDYYNGAGCQHIAFRTHDIISAVENLGKRGVNFLTVPENYYATMKKRLAASNVSIAENIDTLQKYNILIDFDEGGYLLQIFTKHVVDRPTVFIEIIQRENFDGFGAGNFRSLFEAFERDQAARGNL